MPKEKREVEAGLEAKGFRRGEGDHHYFVYWSLSGKKSMARTKISHGSDKDISDELLSRMSQQCGLTKKQFVDLVECPLKREPYEQLLVQRSKLAREDAAQPDQRANN
jgi:hypothetical protein